MIKKVLPWQRFLITLGIIGVVAAMVIPTLISNTQTEQYRVGLKKAYSTLTQAINAIYAQNSAIDLSSDDNFINELSTQISMQKTGTFGSLTTLPANFNYKCYKETGGTCGNILVRPGIDGMKAFVTTNGVLYLIFPTVFPNCDGGNWHVKMDTSETFPQNNVCATLFVDLNGDKNPNQLGMDVQYFYLVKKNNNYYVRPAGANVDTTCLTGYPEDYNKSLHCTNRMLLDMPMP